MSGQWDNDGPAMKFGLPVKLWMIIILMFLCIFSFALLPKSVPFVNPQIKTEPYVWPQGCERKKYTDKDQISDACLSDIYYIGDGQQWGWRRYSKRPYYYRVNNDAIMVSDLWSTRPRVMAVVEDAFVTQDFGGNDNGVQ